MKLRFVAGNQIDLLNSGHEYFPALLAALDGARQEIYLEAYIFAQDATANAVVEHLCSAARRGARVHVLVDGFGARDMSPEYRARLHESGARVHEFRRPMILQPVRGMRRMHRKLVVVDGTCAFVGGINIVDDWNAPDEVPPRYDYAVRVRGPLVAEIHAAARHLWTVSAYGRMHVRNWARTKLEPGPPCGTALAALAIRDNVAHRTEIEDAYIDAIRSANSTIVLASGYFLPSQRFVRELRAATRRGVVVTIIVQGPSDHPLLKAATQSLYRRLLGAGIGLVEYGKSFLHAKVAVVDDVWATVGSSNIDPFSLLLSREANVVVSDAQFAAQLRESLEAAVAAGGIRITLADLTRTRWYTRVAQWLAYRFARLTVDIITPHGGRTLA
jgi:cardiolipin synthase